MQNFSQNNNIQDDDQNGADKQDKSRQKNTIQRETIMVESDYRKLLNEKNALDMEIRQLKKEDAHIKISLQEKTVRLDKVAYQLLQAETTLKGLKKKLNLIG